MTPEFANRLMLRPLVEQRVCKTKTPRGKLIAGWLVAHDGDTALIKRYDGKRDFRVPLAQVAYR